MTDIRFHVEPGGPAAVIALPELEVRKLSVGPMDNNAYLLTDLATGQQLLVDAAADAHRLVDLVNQGTGRLDLIITTHSHPDHTGALRELAAWSGAATAAGEDDADALPLRPTLRLVHGQTLALGRSALRVVGLRGHTPGGIAVQYTCPRTQEVHVLSGDSLFPGGVGNTKRPEQDFDQLLSDVESRLFDVLPDAHVHPGHGDSTTLATERPHLAEWRARGW